MMLVGIAGIVWIAAKKGTPFKQILHSEKIKIGVDAAKKITAERGIQAVEKLLRQAKIYAMRLERFFTARLEALVARKNGKPNNAENVFWKNMRGRAVGLKKTKSSSRVADDIAPASSTKGDEVLARLTKERDSEKEKS
jgi:cobalamin biosynthesis protein CbiG